MGSSKQTTTNNQTRNPYAPAQPGLNTAGGGLNQYLQDPTNFQAYSGPRVAQMTGQTQQGLTDLAASQGGKQSADYLSGVIGGQYLNQGNPYQTQLDNSIISSVMPSINNAFSAAGMTGSTLNQTALTQGLTNGLAAPRYQNYQSERANQQQAAGMLPGISQGNAQNEITAGQMGEQYTQANLDAARQQYAEQQQANIAPYQNAVPLISQIGGAGGTQTGKQTTSSTPSLGQQIAGGAMLGASVLGAPMTGGASLGFGANTLGGMIGNAAQGAPASYGSSWSPWVRSFG
jgi:hypothetical protein